MAVLLKKGFVSRGGIKLQSAIENWKLQIENLSCLDVGASTGGFTDCLLQNGAARVYALDTCYGELAWKLRKDSRVVVMERTNILHIGTSKNRHPKLASGAIDLVVIDAGWTKLELILPIVRKFLKQNGSIVALLKPHYETDRKDLVKGVLSEDKAEATKEIVIKKIQGLGFKVERVLESPIAGGAGNKEYLVLIKT